MQALRINNFKNIKKDYVFIVSLILAIISSFITIPTIKYIDFKVIVSLFNLMIVIKAFEELKVMDKFAVYLINKCSSKRQLSLVLIGLCFFSSMFITNDVSLITFVPLSISIAEKTEMDMMDTIILQTIAANIGSSITPMGNPQNLYMFSFYNFNAVSFFSIVLPLALIGIVVLYLLNVRLKNKELKIEMKSIQIKNKENLIGWLFIFLLVLLSVFRVVSYVIAFVATLAMALKTNAKLVKKADYFLLMTFVCFFIFIGNISNIKVINDYLINNLKGGISTYTMAILSSQFISNVPSAILLSHFTHNAKALLLGVNIGGLGTLIASLASIISYKIFVKYDSAATGKYLLRFSLYNFSILFFMTIIGAMLFI